MRILIVEPELHGHKAFYLVLILKAFQEHELTVLTQPEHPALAAHSERQGIDLNTIELIPVQNREPAYVYQHCIELNAERDFDRTFITYLDHYLPQMTSGKVPLRSPIHGIWFHPHALDRKYNWLPPIDKRIRQRREIHRWLKGSASQVIEHIYFLDPDAPKQMEALNRQLSTSYLPDPGERPPKRSQREARTHFNLPHDRIIFLHAGSPEKRKGLPDLIDAFYQLSKDAEWRTKSLLLRIGPNDRLSESHATKLKNLIRQGCAKTSAKFVAEEDFIEYFAAADCIVLPYRKFRYSSGILANAIMAEKPVICSDYGLIAKTVKENSLGQCYRHGSVSELARTLISFQRIPIAMAPFSPQDFMQSLREANVAPSNNPDDHI